MRGARTKSLCREKRLRGLARVEEMIGDGRGLGREGSKEGRRGREGGKGARGGREAGWMGRRERGRGEEREEGRQGGRKVLQI